MLEWGQRKRKSHKEYPTLFYSKNKLPYLVGIKEPSGPHTKDNDLHKHTHKITSSQNDKVHSPSISRPNHSGQLGQDVPSHIPHCWGCSLSLEVLWKTRRWPRWKCNRPERNLGPILERVEQLTRTFVLTSFRTGNSSLSSMFLTFRRRTM